MDKHRDLTVSDLHIVNPDELLPVVIKTFNEQEFRDKVQSWVSQGYKIDYMNTSVRDVKGNKFYSYYAELNKHE